MEKWHEDALNDLLVSVANRGYASIPKSRIVRWYGASAFNVAIRHDLRERWKTLLITKKSWSDLTRLRIADVGGDTIVLINNSTFYPDEE